MARNYQQAKIYMICSNDKDCIPYIGSSCKRLLSQRMNQHRDDYKKWKNGKYGFISSFTLFEKYGIENCFIDLIQAFPCSSSDELRARERRWIDDIKCVNMDRPFRTKEEAIQQQKEWYKLNKELILAKGKIYRDEHKEQISEYQKEYQKEYRDEHNEQINKNKKKYRDEHKKELAEKAKEAYECQCGSIIRKDSKAKHEKTKKHQEYLTKLTVCVPAITDLS